MDHATAYSLGQVFTKLIPDGERRCRVRILLYNMLVIPINLTGPTRREEEPDQG
jgi:hypothetical protein